MYRCECKNVKEKVNERRTTKGGKNKGVQKGEREERGSLLNIRREKW